MALEYIKATTGKAIIVAQHPNLSPGLDQFVHAAEQSNGLDLSELKENTLIEVYTQDNVYSIVIIDPKNGAIALAGTRSEHDESDIYFVLGSSLSAESSAIKVDWVGIGLCFRVHRPQGEIHTTSVVKSVAVLNDPDKAKDIREQAEKKRPDALKEATEAQIERWQAQFDEQVRSDFAGPRLPMVQTLLSRFSDNGKCIAATFLLQARDAGKLQEALALMSKHFREHWKYKAPEICGDVITPADAMQWKLAYQETDVPFPE